MAAEEGATKTFLVQSEDGMNFVVSDLEASQSWVIDGDTVCYDGKPIRVDVGGKTLTKVFQYCKKHAYSDGYDVSAWDAKFIAKFIGDPGLETLYDLILASNELKIEGLLALTCQTLGNKIKGKSPHEICDILNIRGVFTPQLHEEHSSGSCASHTALAAMGIIANWWNLELKLVDKALQALHIVRCQEFTGYEPKINGLVRHRFNDFNLAFFDLDKETSFSRGPPLNNKTPTRESVVRSCVNVVSLKDDMLSLTDPCRGLVPGSSVYFEIDLKIKCDGCADKDFSKGMVEFDSVHLCEGKVTMTLGLGSWLSWVELLCAQVYWPVEATIEINVLKGPCNISKVAASTPGNFKDHIILYEAAGGPTVIGDGGSVPLNRRVVAVTREQKLALFIVGGDALEHLALTLGHSQEMVNRRMCCAEVEVKVAWTAVPIRKRSNMIKVVANQRLLL
uniref:SKP1 component POZ domain-containing protein n=2 Tax=Triticum urartu TaxID=4572 RepID=A0A8R7RFN1_TRIUA